MNKLFSYLILDYERPQETEYCLRSLRGFTKIDKSKYSIILLANGGGKLYHKRLFELYQEGYIDELILNKENVGCGFGTQNLFLHCQEKYVIYVQSDQVLLRGITEPFIRESLIANLTGDTKCIDLAERHCGDNVFNERASFMEREFYNSIPNKPGGGPGPYHHLDWNEGYIQEYFRKNNYLVKYIEPKVFSDNGQIARRVNPDGSEWLHHTDTKKQWLLKGPVKEKYVYPRFSDVEWKQVLETQKWEDGKIPDTERPFSFEFYFAKFS